MFSNLTSFLWLLPLVVLALGATLYFRRPPQIVLERIHPPYASVDQNVPVKLELTLHAPFPVRLLLRDPPPKTLIPSRVLEWGGLFWGTHFETITLEVKLNVRGEYLWENVTLEWSDPFGLVWRTSKLEVKSKIIVFPAYHPALLPDLLRPLLSDGKAGARIGLEDPSSLRGVRQYQFGDSLNRIHWRQTARNSHLNYPMVRELERVTSSSLQVHLDVLDTSPRSEYSGPGYSSSEQFVESAVKLAGSLLRQSEIEYQSICLSTYVGRTSPGRGENPLIEALTLLARAQPTLLDTSTIPRPAFGANLVILTQHPTLKLLESALQARATAARVLIVVIHEGFYLEPQQKPRRIWAGLHESVRTLEKQAAVLSEQGVRVFLLRGDQSVLELGTRG